jgi:hypothetical protein
MSESYVHISALWLYVVRMGESLKDEDVDDVTWWRTIEFAFKILAGLGLAK